MFTIKSTSSEGIYYLVNHWNKFKTFWVEPEKIKLEMLFKSEADAIRWAKKLYIENNGIYDTMVIECQYTSAENLIRDFAYMSHYRWASYFDELF